MHCSTNRRYTRNFVSVIPSFTMMHKGNSAPLFSLLHDGLRLRVMHRVYFHCTHSACFRAGTPPGKKYKAKDKKRVTQNAQLQNYPRLVWQACANSAGPGRGPGSGTRCPENSIPAPISSGRHYLTFRPRATPRRDALPFSRARCCPRSSATSVSASVFTPPFFLPRAAKNRKLAGKKNTTRWRRASFVARATPRNTRRITARVRYASGQGGGAGRGRQVEMSGEQVRAGPWSGQRAGRADGTAAGR